MIYSKQIQLSTTVNYSTVPLGHFTDFHLLYCRWFIERQVSLNKIPHHHKGQRLHGRGNNLPIHPVMQSFSLYHVAFIMKIMYIPILADKYEVK